MSRLRLALALILVVAGLGTIQTASAHGATPFTASGGLCLVGLPEVTVAPSPTGVLVIASGESLEGTITTSQEWTDLEGAKVLVTIDREKSSFNFGTLTFSGRLTGRLTIATDDSVLSGKLHGTVSGKFSDPANLLASIYESSSEVDWTVGDTDTLAKGHASSTFTPDPTSGAFCGTANLTGKLIRD